MNNSLLGASDGRDMEVMPRHEGRSRYGSAVGLGLAGCALTAVAYYSASGRNQGPGLSAGSGALELSTQHHRGAHQEHEKHDGHKEPLMFLHIADTHSDPFYDYTQFFIPAEKISRSPDLFSQKTPAENCGWETESLIFEHWNKSGGGPSCPCGQYGANPPFSVLASLRKEIEKQVPDFVIWSGDFVSHYMPGTAPGDKCRTARSVAKTTVSMVNAQTWPKKMHHMFVLGNNDVLPKRAPMEQEWLEEFGAFLFEAGWLKEAELVTWNTGGFFKRQVGGGLCVLNLNSNSWTANQINEKHHAAQLKWFHDEAFADPECKQYLINAHIPLGWLEGGSGHHVWSNLEGAEVPLNSEQYRVVIRKHSNKIIAELYGHINKADIRLMDGKQAADPDDNETVRDDPHDDELGDLDDDIGGNGATVSFTVAGISRRGLNDPQFQRIYLEKEHGAYEIQDIDVIQMMKGCDFEVSFSFVDQFKPHFDTGINIATLKNFVEDESMKAIVESQLALSASPYDKTTLKDPLFLASVRAGIAGCEVRKEHR